MLFQLAKSQARAGAGDIVVAPPGVAHRFTNPGPDRARLVCIHASPAIQTEWFE